MAFLSRTVDVVRAPVFGELEKAIAQRRAAGGDIIPLHIGDTTLPPPEMARFERQLAHSDRDEELYAYGPTTGLVTLREAITAFALGKNRGFEGMRADTHVHVGVGATHALACAARAVLEPGDEVILASPYWPLAHGILAIAGARVVEVPLTSLLYEDPSLDVFALLSRAVTAKTRAIYFITPNNPDGFVLSPNHLESIARLVIQHDLWVFADEVYADYAFAPKAHHSISRLASMSTRTISAYSFSKSHALAGARIGYVLAPENVITVIRKLSTHSVFNVPVMMQRSALAALSDETWVHAAKEKYRIARDMAFAALQGSGIRTSLAGGGVYLFLDFSEVLANGDSLSALLERAALAGVLLAPGAAFGDAFPNCARLCYTSAPIERVVEGIARLRSAL